MRKSLDEFTHSDLLNLRLSNPDRPHVLELIEAVEAELPSLKFAPGLLCVGEAQCDVVPYGPEAFWRGRSIVLDQHDRLRHAAAPGQVRRQAHA